MPASGHFRRDGRAAEGAPLLREYGVKSSIEGSNPSLSASILRIVRKLTRFDPVRIIRVPAHAPVAQLDRVPGYEPGGREFESLGGLCGGGSGGGGGLGGGGPEPRDGVPARLLLTRIPCLSTAKNPFTRSAMLTLAQRKSLIRGVAASTALGGSAVPSTSVSDGGSVKCFYFPEIHEIVILFFAHRYN